MTPKQLRCLVTRLLSELPPIPQPWDIHAFCEEIAKVRRRPLTLHAVELIGFPSAMWYGTADHDHILYRASTTGRYRDHVILHEMCHMIAGHGAARANVSSPWSACSHTTIEEKLAEAFATVVLERSRAAVALTPFERRSLELFGA